MKKQFRLKARGKQRSGESAFIVDKLPRRLLLGRQPVPVTFADATYGATSQAPFCEAEKAFTDDHYASWTSDDEAPQTIWVQFQKVGCPLRVRKR